MSASSSHQNAHFSLFSLETFWTFYCAKVPIQHFETSVMLRTSLNFSLNLDQFIVFCIRRYPSNFFFNRWIKKLKRIEKWDQTNLKTLPGVPPALPPFFLPLHRSSPRVSAITLVLPHNELYHHFAMTLQANSYSKTCFGFFYQNEGKVKTN